MATVPDPGKHNGLTLVFYLDSKGKVIKPDPGKDQPSIEEFTGAVGHPDPLKTPKRRDGGTVGHELIATIEVYSSPGCYKVNGIEYCF